jgi:hypothetical protein
MLIQCIHAGHEIEIATVLPLGPTFRRRQVNVGPHVSFQLFFNKTNLVMWAHMYICAHDTTEIVTPYHMGPPVSEA